MLSCKSGVHRGDIALFAYPNDRSVSYIKRVISLPGDQVVLKERQVWVNGQALHSAGANPVSGLITEALDGRQWQVQWVDAPTSANPAAVAPPMNRVTTAPAKALQLTVPDGQVFVLGDNRNSSVDSRSFGTVPMQDILGRARQVWFSSDAQGVNWSRLGLVLQ